MPLLPVLPTPIFSQPAHRRHPPSKLSVIPLQSVQRRPKKNPFAPTPSISCFNAQALTSVASTSWMGWGGPRVCDRRPEGGVPGFHFHDDQCPGQQEYTRRDSRGRWSILCRDGRDPEWAHLPGVGLIWLTYRYHHGWGRDWVGAWRCQYPRWPRRARLRGVGGGTITSTGGRRRDCRRRRMAGWGWRMHRRIDTEYAGDGSGLAVQVARRRVCDKAASSERADRLSPSLSSAGRAAAARPKSERDQASDQDKDGSRARIPDEAVSRVRGHLIPCTPRRGSSRKGR